MPLVINAAAGVVNAADYTFKSHQAVLRLVHQPELSAYNYIF